MNKKSKQIVGLVFALAVTFIFQVGMFARTDVTTPYIPTEPQDQWFYDTKNFCVQTPDGCDKYNKCITKVYQNGVAKPDQIAYTDAVGNVITDQVLIDSLVECKPTIYNAEQNPVELDTTALPAINTTGNFDTEGDPAGTSFTLEFNYDGVWYSQVINKWYDTVTEQDLIDAFNAMGISGFSVDSLTWSFSGTSTAGDYVMNFSFTGDDTLAGDVVINSGYDIDSNTNTLGATTTTIADIPSYIDDCGVERSPFKIDIRSINSEDVGGNSNIKLPFALTVHFSYGTPEQETITFTDLSEWQKVFGGEVDPVNVPKRFETPIRIEADPSVQQKVSLLVQYYEAVNATNQAPVVGATIGTDIVVQ